ncbi:amino acid adenylation domain-containing protein [Photobacterium sagamiensis]|uniref:amino acid adenylation domain-containing protein n=1 Tax=Photobacterium sagamiensis TaxID=2910241 RepID=UPI003D0986D0
MNTTVTVDKDEFDVDATLFIFHPAQESVYFEQQLHPDSPMYNIGGYQVIDHLYDIPILQRSWRCLCEKLDSLRLNIVLSSNSAPRQYVDPTSLKPVLLEYLDFSDSATAHDDAQTWMQHHFDTPMDYLNGERHQIALLKIAPQKYYLFTRFHHLFIDGLGLYRLYERLHQVYHSIRCGESLSWLDNLPQYQEQVINMCEYLNSFRYQKDKAYWQNLLTGNDVTRLPRYYHHCGSREYRNEFSVSLADRLHRYCEQKSVSLLALLTSVTSIYFGQILEKNEILLGTAVHGRPNKKSRQIVGMFSNIIPVLCNVSVDMAFVDFVNQVSTELKQGFRHSRFPASHIARLSDNEAGHLSDIHVLFEQFKDEPLVKGADSESIHHMEIIPISSQHDTQPLQIRLIDYQSNQKLALRVSYSKRYFDKSEITRLTDRLINMLQIAIQDETVLVGDLPLLLDSEIDSQLKSNQQVDLAYPQSQTLHRLFEAQAEKMPDSVALLFEDQQLTYGELNEKANQLAQAIRLEYQNLREEPLKTDTLIALYLDRSLEMVVTILAVLKAGAAYLPIDPKAPQERTQFMLQDAQAAIILTQQHRLSALDCIISPLNFAPILMPVDVDEATAGFSSENLMLGNKSTDLAYVIYTSGTTGKPKGVLQPHQNVTRLFATTESDFQFNANDVWVLYHAYTFDFSVWELWGALLNGGALVIPTTESTKDFSLFIGLCQQYQVTVLNQTPAAFYSLANQVVNNNQLWPDLRYVIFGGDKLNLAQLKPWWDKYGDQCPRLINMYGITETTVHVTFKALSLSDAHSTSHIGRVLNDMQGLILNTELKPVPIGTSGELYIGGAGLARGYLNRPDLTAERFINNPFASKLDRARGYNRLYKTGDLVRRLPDGNLEYLGRNDFQVKIRGYRIELGEIETALVALKPVKQAVVIDRVRDGNKYLAAYIVPEAAGAFNPEQLQDALLLTLPDYMIPATFTCMEHVPLTTNGKVDRLRLPEPEFINTDSYLAPRTALERKLCRIWQKVLGLPKVGIQDNFFRIGGDSIVSIELISLMRREGLNVQVKEIFKAPTVAQLALRLNNGKSDDKVIAEQGLLTGEFNLLPIQQRFFNKKLANPHHWNQAFFINIPDNVTATELTEVVSQLILQHDMLRCRFHHHKVGIRQRYFSQMSDVNVTLQKINIASMSDSELSDKLSSMQSGFDYSKGPLWQVAHLTGYRDGSARLWFAFHHLIIDVVSWRILADDIHHLLTGGELDLKTSSYRQWVKAVSDYAEKHNHEASYWQSIQENQVLLPSNLNSQTYHFSLTASLTDSLLREANFGYETEINDLLLSALAIALSQLFDSPVNHITLEAHGRESIDPSLDVTRTLGWFTTTYPVRLVNKGDIAETITHIKQMLRDIPNKGLGYGALWQNGDLAAISLPEISFNYFGQFDNHDESPGSANWQISSQGGGCTIAQENDDRLLLDINGVVTEGKLQFNVKSRLAVDKSKSLIEFFELALTEIIENAKSQALNKTAMTETNSASLAEYALPGNRQWYFQRSKDLERWGPCVLFEFDDSGNYTHSMEQAIAAVIVHHEGLRINIIGDGNERKEQIKANDSFDCFCYQDFSAIAEDTLESKIAEFRNSINFSQSLIRFLYCDMGKERKDKLYIVIHHLVMDRYSISVFLRDLLAAFDASEKEHNIELTRVGSTFSDWCKESQYWLNSETAETCLQFWSKKRQQRVTPLPTDYEFSHALNSIGTRRSFNKNVSIELTNQLKKNANENGFNEFYFIITAIAKVISNWVGGGQICYEEVLTGRDHYDNLDLSGTVGWLNDYLPIFVNPDNGKHGIELVQSVREAVLECKEYSIGFNDLKYKASHIQSRYDISDLFCPEIDINYIPESLAISNNVHEHNKLNLVRYDEMLGDEREAIHKLSCTVFFNEGALVFSWEYGDEIYKFETVEQLSDACIAELAQLTEACESCDFS